MRNFWQGQQLGQGRATTRTSTARQSRAGKQGNTKVFQGDSEFTKARDNVRILWGEGLDSLWLYTCTGNSAEGRTEFVYFIRCDPKMKQNSPLSVLHS